MPHPCPGDMPQMLDRQCNSLPLSSKSDRQCNSLPLSSKSKGSKGKYSACKSQFFDGDASSTTTMFLRQHSITTISRLFCEINCGLHNGQAFQSLDVGLGFKTKKGRRSWARDYRAMNRNIGRKDIDPSILVKDDIISQATG
jgi:hypothetical protein